MQPAATDPYYADFPASEYLGRVQRLQASCQKASIDALLLSAKPHLRYLTGYRSPFWDMAADVQLAILPADLNTSPTLVLPSGYEFTAQTACICEVQYASPDRLSPFNDVCDLAVSLLKDIRLATGTLAMDLDVGSLANMPPAAFERVRAQLPDAHIVNTYPMILELRQIKSPAELDPLRIATRATTRGLEAAFGQLHAGMSKKEFGEILCNTMLTNVGESCHTRQWLFFLGAGQDMVTWCNFDATAYRFADGDMIVADGGCTYRGYCADMMRWGCIGQPSQENRYLLDVVTEALEAGKAVLRAGVTDGEVDAAMRRIIARSHIDSTEWQMAPFSGHGIGLEVHELPRLLQGGNTVLEPGMTLSVEPLLLKQSGGRFSKIPGAWSKGSPPDMMVMEDNVVVTGNGYELLSPLPTELWKGR